MPTKKSEQAVTTLPPGDSTQEAAPIKRRRGRPVGSGKNNTVVASGSSEPHISSTGKTTVKYVTNAELMKGLKESKAQGRMTEDFARMLMMLVRRYASKGSYVGYTYNDEMQSFAILNLTRNWAAFDETRFSNCFAYYTQCAKNAFIQYMQTEKKHQRLRDELMIEEGLLPSWSYQLDHAAEHHNDYSGDHDDSIREYPGEPVKPSGGGGFSSRTIDRHFEAADNEDLDDEDVEHAPDDLGIKPRHELDDFTGMAPYEDGDID